MIGQISSKRRIQMRKKSTKLISIVMSVLLVSMLVANFPPVKKAEAVIVGTSGTIPAGGTPNPGGGLTGWGYRVGIITEKLKPSAVFENDRPITWTEDRIRTHYNNHYPNMQNSIMFIPSSQWENNAVIGWYTPSSGTIQYLRDETIVGSQKIQDYKMRQLASSFNSPNNKNIYYTELVALAPFDKKDPATNRKYTLNEMLGNSKWTSLVNTSSDTTNSLKVWNYIFSNISGIQDRLKEYIADERNDGTPPQRWEAKLKYIDLLMTLYTISYPEQRKVYEVEINRLIAGSDELLTNPVLLGIDTVSAFHAPGLIKNNAALFMPSTAYVQYSHGGTPKWDITDENFNGGAAVSGGTKGIIQKAATESIKQLSSRKRLSDLAGNNREDNGLAWAYGGVVGAILYTDSGGFKRWGTTSATSPVMKLLDFNKDTNTYGFMVVGGPSNTGVPADPGCQCAISTTEKGGAIIGDTIGKQVPIKVDVKGDKAVWEKYLKKPSSTPITVRIDITRTGGSGTPTLTSQGSAPKLGTFVKVSNATLLSWLRGDSSPIYNDNLSSYNLPNGQSVTFTYKAHVQIKVGTDPIFDCGDTKQIKVTFNNNNCDDCEPEKGYYRSTPSYWSEIKEGAPGSEEFEAMSGTPTNRPLYFASGGSEFIVDIETEYVPDTTSTRTYRSYYTGVASEFKIGDQAKDYTVPSPSGANSSSLTINAHAGGTVTATWSGTTPYTGNLSWGDHYQSGSDKWNDDPYKAAKDQALAWATAVNGYTIKFTSASDKITRSFNSWGASITSDSNTHPAGSVSIGHPFKAAVTGTCGTPPSTYSCITSPEIAYQATTGKQGTDGSYSITVTASIPARIIDGPSSIYDLPGIEDTWTQEVNYDYMKINKVHVWKLDRSKVNGMTELLGTDEVTATIKQGDPTIFANIAASNTSLAGRLRYSLETNQHDTVTWYEGTRTNKDDGRGDNGWITGPGQTASWATGSIYTNSSKSKTVDYHVANSTAEDRETTEWKQFDARRRTLTTVTAVSDFLILQTSSGDQSVIYFDKLSPAVEAQKRIDVPKTSKQTMWDNNTKSAAKWTPNQINIGSYNGQYSNPSGKYTGSGSGTRVPTVFDTMPAGLNRTARPTSSLRLMETNLDVIDTIPNGKYVTGDSTVFYKYLSFHKGTNDTEFSSATDADYGMAGQSFDSTYSNTHSKVNDVVIHDPVSTELSMVVPLDSWRDQRTALSQAIGGNLQSDIEEYDRQLNPDYRPNLLFNGDAEYVNPDGSVSGWLTWTNNPSKTTFTSRRGDPTWTISDTSSFEINATTKVNNGGANISAVYYQDIPVTPGMHYRFTGKTSCHRCIGGVYIDYQDSSHNTIATLGSTTNSTETVQPFTLNVTAPANAAYFRIGVTKGNSLYNAATSSIDFLFVDDLSVINVDSQTADKPIGYKQVPIPNPGYQPMTTTTFNYTGSVQTFTAQRTGIHTFEVWGAQGGGAAPNSSSGSRGGAGGYSKGEINLTAGQTVSVYVGGQGTYASAVGQGGGYNGGGNGGPGGYGGGGATDIRVGGTALSNRKIVAGGGGGADDITGELAGQGNDGSGGAGGGTIAGNATIDGFDAVDTVTSPNLLSADNSYFSGSSVGSWGAFNYYGSGVSVSKDNSMLYRGHSSMRISRSGFGDSGAVLYLSGLTANTDYYASMYVNIPTAGSNDGNGLLFMVNSSNSSGMGQTHWSAATGGWKKISLDFNTGSNTSGYWRISTGDIPEVYVANLVLAPRSSLLGAGGTQSSGYSLGQGESVTASPGSGTETYYLSSPHSVPDYYSNSWTITKAGATSIRVHFSTISTESCCDHVTTSAGNNWTGSYSGWSSWMTGDTMTVSMTTDYSVLSFGFDIDMIEYTMVSSAPDSGGAGGGYYGGEVTNHYNGGGGGGSGYIGGVSSGTMASGVNLGNGKAVITGPSSGDDKFIMTWVKDPEFNYSFPDEAYILVKRTTHPNDPITIPGGGTYRPGNFINLDYGFEIYFPNKGDFLGDSAWGIGTTTATRGRGFYGNPAVAGDEMDTTEWTQSKSVTFDFNVIYNGAMYTSGEEIDLPVNCNSYNCRYPFYLPLANSEAISAVVTFKAVAINGIALDNDYPTNRIRGSFNLDAKHSAVKLSNIDIVGRIGNMAIEDTGDFRFSNFFKKALSPISWIVTNVVKRVDVNVQNEIIGDTRNIRGELANASHHYLNTYGKTAHLDKEPVEFPLSPEKNPKQALKRQPMRLGYNVLADFQTIGNYYESVQIIPYYYSLNLQTGTYTPVDIYMLVNSEYKPINIYEAAKPDWDPSIVYKHMYQLDWEGEKGRRNYSPAERMNTESVIQYFTTTDDGGNRHTMLSPYDGKYPSGYAQIMYLQERNRTFIGSSKTYGDDKNPGNTLPEQLFGLQGQRWHFTIGLPSSAVAVAHGAKPTQANIRAFRNNTSVLVMAADVVSIGDTFALRYESAGMNNPIQISGTSYATTSIEHPVIAVYSANKSSADDLKVSGTH